MCFSATASFAVAGALGVAGALSVYKTKKQFHLFFSAIPLLFATQQAAEGFVWLGLNGVCPQLLTTAMYTFLFFAFIFWPFWIPFSLWIRESKPQSMPDWQLAFYDFVPWLHAYRKPASRSWQLGLLTIIGGVGFTLLALAGLYEGGGATVTLADGHLFYGTKIPVDIVGREFWYLYALYLMCTVLPFFISSMPYAKVLGSFIFAAFIYTYYTTPMALTSVWCFYAAIVSTMILWMAWRKK